MVRYSGKYLERAEQIYHNPIPGSESSDHDGYFEYEIEFQHILPRNVASEHQ
jgi:hypothetical protein